MYSLDLLNKYAELNALWMEKKAMLDIYVEQSVTGKTQISPNELRSLVNQINKQIAELESKANQVHAEYLSVALEESKKRATEKLKQGIKEAHSNNTDIFQENAQASIKK